jgi:hypothetical protein
VSESASGMRRRAAVSQESSFRTSDATWTQIRGIEDLQVTINQEALPDNRHVTSRKIPYGPYLGAKSAQATFRVPWHDALIADITPLLKSAFGTKSAVSLTFNAAGSTDGVVVKSAGTHDPIIAATAGGVIYARPIKSVSSNDGTLGIKLPGAATAATNADATNGALFYADPDAATATVQMEVDRAGENDSLPYILKGGVVVGMAIEVDLAGRMYFGFTVDFYDWTQDTASNISNPSDPSGHFLGMSAEAFIQDGGSPAVGTQLDIVRLVVDLVPERIARNAMRAPAGTVPGNPAVGIYTGRFCVGGVRVTYSKISSTPNTDWAARTAKRGLFNWHMGRPAATATKDIVSLSFPKLVPSGYPQEVDVDGLVGLEVPYVVEEDVALTAPYGLPALGFFSAA